MLTSGYRPGSKTDPLIGVLDVALSWISRRRHLRDQISLREISERLGNLQEHRRRTLRSETIVPAYADRRSASAFDVSAFKLSAALKTESTKSRKQKRSLKQMHAFLRSRCRVRSATESGSIGEG